MWKSRGSVQCCLYIRRSIRRIVARHCRSFSPWVTPLTVDRQSKSQSIPVGDRPLHSESSSTVDKMKIINKLKTQVASSMGDEDWEAMYKVPHRPTKIHHIVKRELNRIFLGLEDLFPSFLLCPTPKFNQTFHLRRKKLNVMI